MAHADVVSDHVGQGASEQMRLVYVQVDADTHRLLCAHRLRGGHSRLAPSKDLAAVRVKIRREMFEWLANLWAVNSSRD